jgi:uncharacterized protein
MIAPLGHPVVHLELRTGNVPEACAFYMRLFGWRAETIHIGSATYVALGRGNRIEVGVVEGAAAAALWLPYVEVADIAGIVERARRLGASVPLEPREGPAGWRSVIEGPNAAEVGLWQPK